MKLCTLWVKSIFEDARDPWIQVMNDQGNYGAMQPAEAFALMNKLTRVSPSSWTYELRDSVIEVLP